MPENEHTVHELASSELLKRAVSSHRSEGTIHVKAQSSGIAKSGSSMRCSFLLIHAVGSCYVSPPLVATEKKKSI